MSRFAIAFAAALTAACLGPLTGFAATAPIAAERGMVVTDQHLASQIGVDVLRQGGNAVDAAVAVGYALAVVLPWAGNIGGGGFMTLRLADGTAAFLDFRERAPLAATATMYQDAAGNLVPHLSTDGHLAVAVPGSVLGLETALGRYGTMPRDKLMAPAIALAEEGFVLEAGDAAPLAAAADGFRKDKAAAAIFLREGGKPYRTGDRLVQKDLAESLRRIARDGAAAFYQGPIGAAIAAASQAGGGILQPADFERYRVRDLDPIRCTYRGYLLISAPPPSSGGITLCEILNILEGYPLGALGFHSAAASHLEIEAMRHAYRDRNTLLGDPDFVSVPVAHLLDKKYAAEIRAGIDAEKAGKPEPAEDKREGAQTTHYSIVDAAGNAVSVTYTLNGSFGAKVVAGGTGILLNDEMDDFTTKPGAANLYGLVQGEANAIAPGKTPLSSMSPTIVEKAGKPVMVIGSPGGSRIITIVLGVLLNTIDHGMDIEAAIEAPRLHYQGQPDTVFSERGALTPEVIQALAGMGHRVEERGSWGRAEGIVIGGPSLHFASHETAGASALRLFGTADPRGPVAAAVGY